MTLAQSNLTVEEKAKMYDLLQEYMGQFHWFSQQAFSEWIALKDIRKAARKAEIEKELADPILSMKINELGLSTRTRNALYSECVNTVRELLNKGRYKLMKAEGFGKKCFEEVDAALASRNIHLPDSDGSYPPLYL